MTAPRDLGTHFASHFTTTKVKCLTVHPVAIFHASFHTTKGHTVDWSLTAHDGESIEGHRRPAFLILPQT